MTDKKPIKTVIINDDITIANDRPFVLLAGPCQIESRDHAMTMAEEIQKITTKLSIPYIFKASFDKANRTSLNSKRGVGIEEGLKIFEEIKSTFDVPVITDVHTPEQAPMAAEVVDVLQTPAFLCRQTDFLTAVGKTGKPVNVKKGQFLAPDGMAKVAEKIAATGNDNIMLCERGASFGYNTLVTDMRALEIMARTGYPVVIDATHSVQMPGALGDATGGDRTMVPVIARAAVAVGVGAVFMEIHDDPDNAASDGPNSVRLDQAEGILSTLKDLDQVVKGQIAPVFA